MGTTKRKRKLTDAMQEVAADHTDASYQIVDEDGRLRYRLENFCPHCGKRLYNPNLDK